MKECIYPIQNMKTVVLFLFCLLASCSRPTGILCKDVPIAIVDDNCHFKCIHQGVICSFEGKPLEYCQFYDAFSGQPLLGGTKVKLLRLTYTAASFRRDLFTWCIEHDFEATFGSDEVGVFRYKHTLLTDYYERLNSEEEIMNAFIRASRKHFISDRDVGRDK